MSVRRWLGGTSGDITTAANWSGSTVPVSNDKLIFDSSALADVTSGSFGTFATSVNIGPGFTKSIGTATTAFELSKRFPTQPVTVDFLSGFAHLGGVMNSVTVKSCPFGDGLLLGGDIIDVIVAGGKGGRITLTEDFDCTNLLICPSGNEKDKADILIEEGAEIDNIVVTGNAHVDMYAASVDSIVIAGPNASVRFRSQVAVSIVISGGGKLTIDKTNPTLGTSSTIIVTDGGTLDFAEGCEILGLAASGNVDLMSGGLLDTRNVSNLEPTALGTITSYGGRIKPLTPVTISIPSDTKLSSTSGRSLNFQLAANSGHVPTVLW
tara:strand:+ start:4902 stop:5870 length:969 start_codon:yes stop_codon:yes gene_type:complete